MTSYRVRFEGPTTVALQVATELADADGIDLVSSDQPATLEPGTVRLTVVVEGTEGDVSDAVARISEMLPEGSSLATVGAT